MSILLVACSGLSFNGGSASSGSTGQPSGGVALSRLSWCGKPSMIFRDQAAPATTATVTSSGTITATVTSSGTTTVISPTAVSVGGALGPANGTPTTLDSWALVKANLGFTVFLPPTLPAGTCLVSASSSLRDPILGSNFTITYMLPDHSAISLSQAPLDAQNTTFQCSPASGIGSQAGTAKGSTPTAGSGGVQASTQICKGARSTTSVVFSARGTTAALQQFFSDLQSNINWIPAS